MKEKEKTQMIWLKLHRIILNKGDKAGVKRKVEKNMCRTYLQGRILLGHCFVDSDTVKTGRQTCDSLIQLMLKDNVGRTNK